MFIFGQIPVASEEKSDDDEDISDKDEVSQISNGGICNFNGNPQEKTQGKKPSVHSASIREGPTASSPSVIPRAVSFLEQQFSANLFKRSRSLAGLELSEPQPPAAVNKPAQK